ncbi:MAG: hydrogenase iron-sulfur subunit [Crenarchaeota archaeon]|nr:hydrogenase iron-sulfur subunit [Thermoproteota archaeon]
MSEKCLAAVKINQDLCSRCSVCYSVCPFEAIKRDVETGKVEIDDQKCQVCGICYSACPVSAIEMAYYDYDNLLEHVDEVKQKTNGETLVMMCRGNSPSDCEIKDILSEQGLIINNYIPLRLPCAGRVPTDFVFKVLSSGIKNILSIQCEDKFCRMKDGTQINTKRFILGKNVLTQLGYDDNALKVVKFSRKAVWDSEECVGCDKCVFVCPYDAIKVDSFSSPRIILDDCVGCGACQLVCPHHAIQVKGYEFENVLYRYAESAKKLKAQNNTPAVLVFACQWSEYPGLDHPDCVIKGKNAVILEVPCFKGLDPVHIVNALSCGFDGVLGVVCSPDDCKMQQGRDTAERNMDVTTNMLKKLNLLDRFEMVELSPRCEGKFEETFTKFYNKIATMPQCALKKEAN